MKVIKSQIASLHLTNYKPCGADLFNYKGVNPVYAMDKQNVQGRLQVTKLVNPKGL